MTTESRMGVLAEDRLNAPEWNLSDLYQGLNDKQIDIDFESAFKMACEFVEKYKGNVINLNQAGILKAVKEYERIGEKSAKIFTFAYLHKAKDSSNEKIAIFYQNVADKVSKLESDLLFFSLEMNKFDESVLEEYFKDDVELSKYSSWFRKIFRFKKHNLSDEAEKVLYLKNTTSSSMLIRLFDEFFADIQFPFQNKKLSTSEIFFYMSSSNETDRKDAASSISEVLSKNSKLLTMIMNMVAKDKLIEDELRGFTSVLSSRNLVNDIEDSVVEKLIKTVKDWYPRISHRYFSLKAKWMKKDHLNYWDRNAPLHDNSSILFSWSEAKAIVLKAFKNFSPALHDEAEKFFDNGWIDAKVTKGKSSGAFCHPCVPSVHPYMLMNFQGKIYDIMTLAHELGHCVHYMLSSKNGYLANDIPLTFAETASVFAEQLVFRHLMKVDMPPQEKKNLIAKKVEDMLNTVVRQIAFCDFETKVHNKRKESELSNDDICKIWMEVQRESLGDSFVYNDEYKPYWSYISHFIHAPFYVYSYAFGDCLVNSLYKYFVKNECGFAEKYLNLLSIGGTVHHEKLLQPFGMSLNGEKFWEQGLSLIEELIIDLERLG